MLLLLVGFCTGFIFWGIVTAVLISGAVIVDEDNSAIKVTFESTKKLLKSKYVVLKVIHGHINGPRE